jgi:hypothetical protein
VRYWCPILTVLVLELANIKFGDLCSEGLSKTTDILGHDIGRFPNMRLYSRGRQPFSSVVPK